MTGRGIRRVVAVAVAVVGTEVQRSCHDCCKGSVRLPRISLYQVWRMPRAEPQPRPLTSPRKSHIGRANVLLCFISLAGGFDALLPGCGADAELAGEF